MTRRPGRPSRVAVAMQSMSLLAVAGIIFAILLSDISRPKGAITKLEAPADVQLDDAPSRTSVMVP